MAAYYENYPYNLSTTVNISSIPEITFDSTTSISVKISNNQSLVFPNKSDDTTVEQSPKQCEEKIEENQGKSSSSKFTSLSNCKVEVKYSEDTQLTINDLMCNENIEDLKHPITKYDGKSDRKNSYQNVAKMPVYSTPDSGSEWNITANESKKITSMMRTQMMILCYSH